MPGDQQPEHTVVGHSDIDLAARAEDLAPPFGHGVVTDEMKPVGITEYDYRVE